MQQKEFAGDKKEGRFFFSEIEKRILDRFVPKVPSFIETHHLTLMTVLWSTLIIVFSALAANNINWLWAVSAVIVLQYITDLFDGAIGRFRKTGLIKWGYYMDHLLDYVFVCSIFIGYFFILPDQMNYILLFLFAVSTAFIVNAYLSFAVTNKFKIYFFRMGPTEARLLLIIINTLLIIFGISFIMKILPYVLVISILLLTAIIYRTQKYIWKIDMQNKKNM